MRFLCMLVCEIQISNSRVKIMREISITKRLEHERVQIDYKVCAGIADLEISGFRGFYNL